MPITQQQIETNEKRLRAILGHKPSYLRGNTSREIADLAVAGQVAVHSDNFIQELKSVGRKNINWTANAFLHRMPMLNALADQYAETHAER